MIMAEKDIKELKDLPPEERIKRLKEIEEKKKKEIEEARKLMTDSEDELEDIEEEKRKIPIQQLKSEGLESLETAEEKELFKTKRFVSEKPKTREIEIPGREKELEEVVQKEQVKLAPGQEKQYGMQEGNPLAGMYDTINQLGQTHPSEWRYEQIKQFYQTQEEIEKMEGYNLTEYVAEQVSSMRNAMEHMKKYMEKDRGPYP